MRFDGPYPTSWLRKPSSRLGLLLIVACTMLLLRWNLEMCIFLSLLTGSLTHIIDGRISVTSGLVCLALCPILLIAEHNAWLQQSVLVNYYLASIGIYTLKDAADTLAVWAFYLLSIGAAAQLIDYVVQRTGHRSEQNKKVN